MGFNTTVVVMNDALTDIEFDPDFGKNLAAAIRNISCFGGPINVATHSTKCGVHCNPVSVIETHHADYDVLVRVGGNRGEVVKGD
jgi:hypothetical protein